MFESHTSQSKVKSLEEKAQPDLLTCGGEQGEETVAEDPGMVESLARGSSNRGSGTHNRFYHIVSLEMIL